MRHPATASIGTEEFACAGAAADETAADVDRVHGEAERLAGVAHQPRLGDGGSECRRVIGAAALQIARSGSLPSGDHDRADRDTAPSCRIVLPRSTDSPLNPGFPALESHMQTGSWNARHPCMLLAPLQQETNPRFYNSSPRGS